MDPHCRCHVRAASYLLLDAVITSSLFQMFSPNCNYFTFTYFVAHAWKKREMNRGMDPAKRFEEATAYTSVNLSSLEINKLYPFVHAQRITAKYGPTVLLWIRVSETRTVQVFLPKQYSAVISDDDMDKINSKAVYLYLVYKGKCETSKSYLLTIEK